MSSNTNDMSKTKGNKYNVLQIYTGTYEIYSDKTFRNF